MTQTCKLKGTNQCPYLKDKVPDVKPQCRIRVGTKSNCKYFIY